MAKKSKSKSSKSATKSKVWPFNKLWFATGLGVVVGAFGGLIVAFAAVTGAEQYSSARAYVGLSHVKAVTKAEDSGVTYRAYNVEEYTKVWENQDFGLILYVDDDKIVDAEFRVDPRTYAYLGLTEETATEKAETLGFNHRTVERDGQGLPITDDHRNDRINFSVVDGRVVKAELY